MKKSGGGQRKKWGSAVQQGVHVPHGGKGVWRKIHFGREYRSLTKKFKCPANHCQTAYSKDERKMKLFNEMNCCKTYMQQIYDLFRGIITAKRLLYRLMRRATRLHSQTPAPMRNYTKSLCDYGIMGVIRADVTAGIGTDDYMIYDNRMRLKDAVKVLGKYVTAPSHFDADVEKLRRLEHFDNKVIVLTKNTSLPVSAGLEWVKGRNILNIYANICFAALHGQPPEVISKYKKAMTDEFQKRSGNYKVFGDQPVEVKMNLNIKQPHLRDTNSSRMHRELNESVYGANDPVELNDPSGKQYEYIIEENLVNYYNDKRQYYKVNITIDTKSEISTHTFYIQADQDVMLFSNFQNDTAFAARSTDLAEGMLAAFKEVKGYELSGRTVAGVHSELIYHEVIYRTGYKAESTKETNIGTLNIPMGINGNDPDAMWFELARSTAPITGSAMRTWDDQAANMQRLKNDLEYFLSGNYGKDKWLKHFIKCH